MRIVLASSPSPSLVQLGVTSCGSHKWSVWTSYRQDQFWHDRYPLHVNLANDGLKVTGKRKIDFSQQHCMNLSEQVQI